MAVDPTSALVGYGAIRAAEWLVITFCEFKAAKAKVDGVLDWQDTFWSKMLKRLDSARHERVERENNV